MAEQPKLPIHRHPIHYRGGAGTHAAIKGHPIHPMLVPVAIGLYVVASGCDLAFAQSGDPYWGKLASGLLLATLGAGLIAALPGLVDIFSVPRARNLQLAWIHAAGNAAFMIVVAINYAWRQPDPALWHGKLGIFLTVFGLALLGISGWIGGEMTFRHGVGVAETIGTPSEVTEASEPSATIQSHRQQSAA